MINLFFGTAADCPIGFKEPGFPASLAQLAKQLNIPQLTISHQVHGIAGRVVAKQLAATEQPVIDFKTQDGDYLIAHEPGVGIGVLTADCLPLVFYAPDKNIIAVAHAGWRGSVAGIGPVVVERLINDFGIDVQQLKIWFGPAGKACCYEVKQDFVEALEAIKHHALSPLTGRPSPFAQVTSADRSTSSGGAGVVNKNATAFLKQSRGGKLFFDNAEFNKQQLLVAGVLESNIDLSNNHCTICNHEYHSYRRATDKTAYKTQVTIAWL